MPPKSLPVERIGGPQDKGPWPADTEEVVEGGNYRRPVFAGPETGTVEVAVTVTQVFDLGEDAGDAVSYQFQPPKRGA